MVLIRSKRRSRTINYDFWEDVKRTRGRTQRDQKNKETTLQKIKQLLEE